MDGQTTHHGYIASKDHYLRRLRRIGVRHSNNIRWRRCVSRFARRSPLRRTVGGSYCCNRCLCCSSYWPCKSTQLPLRMQVPVHDILEQQPAVGFT